MRVEMTKRTNSSSETLTSNPKQQDEEAQIEEKQQQQEVDVAGKEEEEEGKGGGFFACYLLHSKGRGSNAQTYIGFTVNPLRRIRQHNGELRSRVSTKKSKRHWEMILCIYGFPTKVTALQFKWAWQHPTESLDVRKAAASLKSLSKIMDKIKLAYMMLTLPPWRSLKLTVNYFSTKYVKHAVGCKSLPRQMAVQFCPMDELPCYTDGDQIFYEMKDQDDENDDEEDTENGTDHIHLVPADISGCNISDHHHSSVQTVHNTLKRKQNASARQPAEALTSKGGDHRLHLDDFRSTNSEKLVEDRDISRMRANDLWHARYNISNYHLRGLPTVNNAVKWKKHAATRQLAGALSADHRLNLFGFRSTNLVNSNKLVDYRGILRKRVNGLWQASKEQALSRQQPLNNGVLRTDFGSTEQGDLTSTMDQDSRMDFFIANTRVKMPFSCHSALGKTVQDKDHCGFVQESSDSEVPSPKQCSDAVSSAHSIKPSSTTSCVASAKVDVIDISTPVKMSLSSSSGSANTVQDKDPGDSNEETRDLEVLSPKQCSDTLSSAHSIKPSSTTSCVASAKVDVIDISTPVKTSFSSNSGSAKTVQDKDPGDSNEEPHDLEVLSPKQCPETPSAYINQVPSAESLTSPKVEVIDISTPPSNRITDSLRIKKRINWVSQDIVDLTQSPKLVQLQNY